MPKRRIAKASPRARLTNEKNRIRGLIGAAKRTTAPVKKSARQHRDNSDRIEEFQSNLSAALIKSREELSMGQFDKFLLWVEDQTINQLSTSDFSSPSQSGIASQVINSPSLPLHKEISWIASRLSRSLKKLRDFSLAADALERIYWSGTWNEIRDQLNSIESAFGKSLWLTEIKIALTQEFEGLESQKRVVAAERLLGPRTVSAYIAHHFGVRNEPTTDPVRFRHDVIMRIGRLNVDDALKDFLQFRIARKTPRTPSAAANILKMAQGLGEIDLLDTLLQISQTQIAREINKTHNGAIYKSLSRLSGVYSDTINSALSALQDNSTTRRSATGEIKIQTIRGALRSLENDPSNHFYAMLIAGLLSVRRTESHSKGSRAQWYRTIRLMSSILKFDDSYDTYLQSLRKHLQNRRAFRTAVRLDEDFIGSLSATSKHNYAEYFKSAGLTNESIQRHRWFSVIHSIRNLGRAIADSDFSFLIENIVKLRLEDRVPLSAIPLRDALARVKWRDIKSLKSSIALPISLHLCWRATDSDIAATNLRYSYEEFLDSHHLSNPAEIISLRDSINVKQMTYFLKEVCVPSVIDMSSHIESSSEIAEVRLRVCAALQEVDPANREQYQAEIVSIVNLQTINEGQTLVDSSRVYVDTGAIRAWADRALETDLQRYAALVRAGVGAADDIITISRSINENNINAYLEVPENEADEILVEMMASLRKQFLLDPQHGLDSYLSRRVRHHSMTGYIRGPVEEGKLITSRNTKSGRYAENAFWLDELKLTGPKRQTVSRAFVQFSEDFDRIILSLKNNLFHVTAPDHPEGLFDFPLTAPMIHLMRSALQVQPSIDLFCTIGFVMYWASLEPSLKEARTYLHQDAKRGLVGVFQKLRANLRRALEDHTDFAEISIAIGRASEVVQAEIDKMADWFVRKEVQQGRQLYSLDKVLEIAIASALASHRPFTHQVSRTVECDFYVRIPALVIIAEIVLTALGNIKAYAGKSKSPVSIILSCTEANHLTIRIENDVNSNLSEKSRDRVNEIRQEITNGEYIKRIREEGGTGLMKIAATANSELGNLEFGFLTDTKFFVEVTLPFKLESHPESAD